MDKKIFSCHEAMKEWNDVRHDVDKSLNLLTDCDQLCHVIHIIYLDRAKMERSAGDDVTDYFIIALSRSGRGFLCAQ